MSDDRNGASVGVDTLQDAFAELERRADARPLADIGRGSANRGGAPMLVVAASVAVVLALSVFVALRLGAGPTRNSADPAGGASHRPAGHRYPVPRNAKGYLLSSSAPTPRVDRVHRVPRPKHQSDVAGFEQKFAAAFHDVAGNTATYTVTLRPGGPVLVGQMTVDGVIGGFDIQDFRAGSGTKASCDDLDRVKCDVRSMPGGASLSTGSEALQTDPGGVTQQAEYVTSDGVEFVMHVSNAADPKGAGQVAAKPPLTIAQMVSLLTSDRWAS